MQNARRPLRARRPDPRPGRSGERVRAGTGHPPRTGRAGPRTAALLDQVTVTFLRDGDTRDAAVTLS